MQKRKVLFGFVFVVFSFGIAFAQTADTPQISTEKVESLAKDYIEKELKRNTNHTRLRVYDIKSYENRNDSTNDSLRFTIEGRFDNFPVAGTGLTTRDVSGRLETKLTIRINSVLGVRAGYDIKKEDQKEAIILKVDDMLSPETRDSMVADYINRKYNNPLGISIANERLDVHPDEIRRYVTAVTNSQNVVYAIVIFRPHRSTLTPYTGIVLQQQQWTQSSDNVLFEAQIPSKKQIDHDMSKDLYAHFTRTNKTILGGVTSGIKALDKIEVARATNGAVKLKVTGVYDVGLLGKWNTLPFSALVSYEYDDGKKQWKYITTEDIDP